MERRCHRWRWRAIWDHLCTHGRLLTSLICESEKVKIALYPILLWFTLRSFSLRQACVVKILLPIMLKPNWVGPCTVSDETAHKRETIHTIISERRVRNKQGHEYPVKWISAEISRSGIPFGVWRAECRGGLEIYGAKDRTRSAKYELRTTKGWDGPQEAINKSLCPVGSRWQ
jgi:hypothetical protein